MNHYDRRRLVRAIVDSETIASSIDRLNLPEEHKELLRIIYVRHGCLDDVCDITHKEYSTVSKWHNEDLIKLYSLLQKH